jgi:hypothetical protein
VKPIIFIIVLIVAAGCTKMLLQPADFAWPMEAVLKVDERGNVSENRYTFSVNVKPIYFEEFADSNSFAGREIRIIKNRAGYYYFTGEGFKNIYMFMPVEGGMKLEDKISVSDTLALNKPIFNQKQQNIQLIDGTKQYLITGSELVRVK